MIGFALYRREKTGKGRRSTPMLENMASFV